MSLFSYTAIDAQGRVQHGTLEATREGDLEQRLARQRLETIRVSNISWRQYLLPFRRSGISRRELIIFCFHLEQLACAGVPLIDGLTDLRDSATTPRLRDLAAALVDDVESGSQLSQALARHGRVFDSIFVNLVEVGEVSGKLPSVLGKLGEMLRWQDELVAQSKKILLYPAFVAAVVLLVVTFLMVYLVPQMLGFLRGLDQELPVHTRLLLACSEFLVTYGWKVLLLLPLLLAGGAWRLRRDVRLRYLVDSWKLRLWVIGPIQRSIILTRFTHFFAMLYDAGIPVVQALRISEGVLGNLAMAAAVARVHDYIIEGEGLASSLQRAGLLSPLAIRMVRVGESSGALDTALHTLSYFYGRDVQESVERIQSLVEPVLTLVLGGLLAWVMLAVLGPIYDIIARIRP